MKKFLKARKIEKRKFISGLKDIRSNPKISDEKDTLAYYVMKLFEDDNLAMKISENSKKTIKTHFPQESIGEKLKQLYLNVSKEK